MNYYEKFCEMKKGEAYYKTDGIFNFRFTKIEEYQFLVTITIWIEEIEQMEVFTNVMATITASMIAERIK